MSAGVLESLFDKEFSYFFDGVEDCEGVVEEAAGLLTGATMTGVGL